MKRSDPVSEEPIPKKKKMLMVPVLADRYLKSVESILFVVGVIKDKRRTKEVLDKVNMAYPLNALNFYKRVTCVDGELRILIAPAKGLADAPPPEHAEAFDGLFSRTLTTEVPAEAPLTRVQYNACREMWPVKFHEDKILENVIHGRNFSLEMVESIENHMSTVIDEVVAMKKQHNEIHNCAAIVNPRTNKVLVIGSSAKKEHPVYHAVMLALDGVARLQGGGHWPGPVKITPGLVREDLATLQGPPYLCTGYDLYVAKEPCIMCCMALVHSRIGRVFVAVEDPERGSLWSKTKLGVNPQLNHSFMVWKNVAEDKLKFSLS